jgi:hypothetical protein
MQDHINPLMTFEQISKEQLTLMLHKFLLTHHAALSKASNKAKISFFTTSLALIVSFNFP